MLFAIFGALMAAAVANTLIVFHRHRPTTFSPDPIKQRWRWRFHRVEPRLRRWLFVIVVGYLSISMGTRAAGNWQTWLQWRHSVSFGQQDPQFHRDISYYVFIYPMHRLVLTYLFRIIVTALIVLLISAYAYGGIRVRGHGPRMTKSVRSQLSLLLALYLILKAFAYWLDRYALVTSNRGVVTGLAYTDTHAVLPGRIVLIVIALIAAAMLLANVFLRSSKMMWTGLFVMLGGAVLVGVAWPAVVQRFREKPSASSLETPFIENNIAATRTPSASRATSRDGLPRHADAHGAALGAQVARNAQIRLLDPNKMSPTFNVKQQVQSYYGFKSTLDIDRYPICRPHPGCRARRPGAEPQRVAGGTQHLDQHSPRLHPWLRRRRRHDDLAAGRAAELRRKQPAPDRPNPMTQPRIYYGQMSPSYSIVGGPAGSKPREFDRPNSTGTGQPANYTHTGGGGVPIGSFFHRLLYAWKLHSASILFSSEINSDSQLLTVRNPRSRVAAVAPWLTLDGDTYPTVVDGHIVWVVDGYTTSNNYPDSQQINLRSATSNTLSQNGATVTQPSTSINYMHNSVKATVDAYSGKVTLYAWNQATDRDPILESWEKSFPGLIKPQTDIPAALVPHLRYPQDLFNVQRSLLTRYHVTDPSEFYSGSDFWKIPDGPDDRRKQQHQRHRKEGDDFRAYPGIDVHVAVSKRLVGRELRAVVSAGHPQPSEPVGVPVGRLRSGSGLRPLHAARPDRQPGSVESPSQIQNDIESGSDGGPEAHAAARWQLAGRTGQPADDPARRAGCSTSSRSTRSHRRTSFPILRHVIAQYGDGQPAFSLTLPAAAPRRARKPLPDLHQAWQREDHDQRRPRQRLDRDTDGGNIDVERCQQAEGVTVFGLGRHLA